MGLAHTSPGRRIEVEKKTVVGGYHHFLKLFLAQPVDDQADAFEAAEHLAQRLVGRRFHLLVDFGTANHQQVYGRIDLLPALYKILEGGFRETLAIALAKYVHALRHVPMGVSPRQTCKSPACFSGSGRHRRATGFHTHFGRRGQRGKRRLQFYLTFFRELFFQRFAQFVTQGIHQDIGNFAAAGL